MSYLSSFYNQLLDEGAAQTIWSQLKQMKLNGFPLLAYLGAKNPTVDKDDLTVNLRGKWKGRVIIHHNKGTDLYDLTFGRVRKYEWKVDAKVLGVEVGNLAHVLQRYVEYGEASGKKGKVIRAHVEGGSALTEDSPIVNADGTFIHKIDGVWFVGINLPSAHKWKKKKVYWSFRHGADGSFTANLKDATNWLDKAKAVTALKDVRKIAARRGWLQEDSPLEAPTSGFNRHAKLMSPATRELVLKSRQTEIEAFAEDRGYNPALIAGIAEASMRLGRVPHLAMYGFAGEDAKAIRHFVAGEILNLAIESRQPGLGIQLTEAFFTPGWVADEKKSKVESVNEERSSPETMQKFYDLMDKQAARIAQLQDEPGKLTHFLVRLAQQAGMDKLQALGPAVIHAAKYAKQGKLKRKQVADAIQIAHDEIMVEVSPPGWSGTTKAMKDRPEIDNPYALAWSMHKKGAMPHKKPEPGKPKYKKPTQEAAMHEASAWPPSMKAQNISGREATYKVAREIAAKFPGVEEKKATQTAITFVVRKGKVASRFHSALGQALLDRGGGSPTIDQKQGPRGFVITVSPFKERRKPRGEDIMMDQESLDEGRKDYGQVHAAAFMRLLKEKGRAAVRGDYQRAPKLIVFRAKKAGLLTPPKKDWRGEQTAKKYKKGDLIVGGDPDRDQPPEITTMAEVHRKVTAGYGMSRWNRRDQKKLGPKAAAELTKRLKQGSEFSGPVVGDPGDTSVSFYDPVKHLSARFLAARFPAGLLKSHGVKVGGTTAEDIMADHENLDEATTGAGIGANPMMLGTGFMARPKTLMAYNQWEETAKEQEALNLHPNVGVQADYRDAYTLEQLLSMDIEEEVIDESRQERRAAAERERYRAGGGNTPLSKKAMRGVEVGRGELPSVTAKSKKAQAALGSHTKRKLARERRIEYGEDLDGGEDKALAKKLRKKSPAYARPGEFDHASGGTALGQKEKVKIEDEVRVGASVLREGKTRKQRSKENKARFARLSPAEKAATAGDAPFHPEAGKDEEVYYGAALLREAFPGEYPEMKGDRAGWSEIEQRILVALSKAPGKSLNRGKIVKLAGGSTEAGKAIGRLKKYKAVVMDGKSFRLVEAKGGDFDGDGDVDDTDAKFHANTGSAKFRAHVGDPKDQKKPFHKGKGLQKG